MAITTCANVAANSPLYFSSILAKPLSDFTKHRPLRSVPAIAIAQANSLDLRSSDFKKRKTN
jgi:hypothetical protein